MDRLELQERHAAAVRKAKDALNRTAGIPRPDPEQTRQRALLLDLEQRKATEVLHTEPVTTPQPVYARTMDADASQRWNAWAQQLIDVSVQDHHNRIMDIFEHTCSGVGTELGQLERRLLDEIKSL